MEGLVIFMFVLRKRIVEMLKTSRLLVEL
jgi:hypothetical protein